MTGISSGWIPPMFPAQGRIHKNNQQLANNRSQQHAEELAYKHELSRAQGINMPQPCCKSLHLSFFFDGTNNNEKADTNAAVPSPSNIARMYHASYVKREEGYHSFYVPGVGTPFPEIGELDFHSDGLKWGKGAETRIHWALVMILSALSYELTGKHYEESFVKNILEKLDRGLVGQYLYQDYQLFKPLHILINQLKSALERKTQPKILKLKLFVYGFSRGAAEARAFMHWLATIVKNDEQGQFSLAGIPLSIEYVGLCDTVAAIGLSRVAPLANGHMAWASEALALPTNAGLINKVYHFVSAHEQRLSFPLDSVRRTEGHYPEGVCEVVYPGVHSDVGGGYLPNDQGKSPQADQLLSQIVLHDLYDTAFAHGAPLMLFPHDGNESYQAKFPDRVADDDTFDEFEISPELINSFNAWQAQLASDLGLSNSVAQGTYQPIVAGMPLEDIIAQQLAWITAWRIARFSDEKSNQHITQQAFYRNAAANSFDQDTEQRKANQRARDAAQRTIEVQRLIQQSDDLAGVRLYEPALDQQQLFDAAANFKEAYKFGVNGAYINNGFTVSTVIDTLVGKVAYILNTDDESAEYKEIIDQADKIYQSVFVKEVYQFNQYSNYDSQFKTYKVERGFEQLVNFYDNHIHDSRAWFMHSAIDGVEPFSSFIRYRMIYFDRRSNKLDLDNLEFYINVIKSYVTYDVSLYLYSVRKLDAIVSCLLNPEQNKAPVSNISIDGFFNQLGNAF